MIPVFDAAGAKLPVTYNGLTLNSPTDSVDDTYELDQTLPHTQYLAISDEKPQGDGTEIYEARKTGKALRMLGRIKAPNYARLFDKLEALAEAFDPALISFLNPPPNDFLALDFSVPTEDTTNWATGLIPCRYYARPLTTVDRIPNKFTGLALPFTLDMFMKDPRRYSQTASTQTGAGTITNIGKYPSWPTLTITASGAGNAAYTVKNTGTAQGALSLVLNLSTLVNTDVVTVDMENRFIYKNGVLAGSLYVSGNYWKIEPGSNVIAITNGTNMTTVTSYRRAWSL